MKIGAAVAQKSGWTGFVVVAHPVPPKLINSAAIRQLVHFTPCILYSLCSGRSALGVGQIVVLLHRPRGGPMAVAIGAHQDSQDGQRGERPTLRTRKECGDHSTTPSLCFFTCDHAT